MVRDKTPRNLFYDHGIRGVQHMGNLLLRNKKPFAMVARRREKSDVLDRLAALARSARLAGGIRRARVGRLGPAFTGMGDFAVAPEKLRAALGIQTIESDPAVAGSLLAKVDDQAVEAETASDRERFILKDLAPGVHRRSTRAGLAIRLWIEKEQLTAFTINFISVDKASSLPAMPFLEASKAVARGVGCASEGDVLAAAVVCALASVYPETNFTEMFCFDWEEDKIFLSNMGEMNVKSAGTTTSLIERPFPFTDVGSPAVAVGWFRAGDAVLANFAFGPNDEYSLTVAPIVMQDVATAVRMADSIHGWFKASLPVGEFLAEYSRAGGTYHSALVYGKLAKEIARWGKLTRWNTVLLQ